MTDPQGNAEMAYASIRQAIVEGRYRAGHRLVEQRIAAEFQLSRTPVREALRILEAEGLVVSERNKGSSVRSLTTDDVHDLYELRARLEALAAELAAGRVDREDLAAINQSIVDFDAAVAGGSIGDLEATRQVNRANQAFHGAVVDAARHDRLQRILARTVDIPLVFRAFREFNREELERSGLFHRLIRDAIAAGDPLRAGRLMTEHILQGRDVLLAVLTDNPEETGD